MSKVSHGTCSGLSSSIFYIPWHVGSVRTKSTGRERPFLFYTVLPSFPVWTAQLGRNQRWYSESGRSIWWRGWLLSGLEQPVHFARTINAMISPAIFLTEGRSQMAMMGERIQLSCMAKAVPYHIFSIAIYYLHWIRLRITYNRIYTRAVTVSYDTLIFESVDLYLRCVYLPWRCYLPWNQHRF